ncbi:MAG: gluconate transporter, partial [Lachnospiraceae bacterium]|nr:gluconate transporter [Lachnospiraceae bacterium]
IGWGYATFVAKAEEKKQLHEDMQAILEDESLLAPDPNKPSALKALLLVLFPILLIVFASIYSMFSTEGIAYTIISFIGNQNVALFLGMLVTGYALRDYLPKRDVQAFIDKAANNTGGILLIVGAGGCFSAVLQATTLSTDLVAIMSAANMPMLLVGFLLACFVRAAVGTGTGAMLAAVAIVGPVCVQTGVSPVLAGLAICMGANAGTFPTDAVFWFPEKYNGLNSKDCIMTTTIPHIMASLIGLAILFILNGFAGSLPGLF